MRKLYYILIPILLSACSADEIAKGWLGGDDELEITSINAYVDGSDKVMTRAISLSDTIGRLDFVADDIMLFTNIQRTVSPIPSFSYLNGIRYRRTEESSWNRIPLEKSDKLDPERIYWSDAESNHTFIGYGCPQGENTPEGFDWYKVTEGEGHDVYYGSLGNPTEISTAENTAYIDYTSEPLTDADITYEQKEAKYLTGNVKICKDDILLSYNSEQKADLGGQVATVKFHHGLCNVRVIVNISGFSASSDAADSKSKVTGLVLEDMLTMYKWTQQNEHAQALNAMDQSYLNEIAEYGSNVPAYNQTKPTKAWIRYPEGKGLGQGKTFTFYALAVPTTGKNQSITFDVTYPDPMNPNTKLVTREYTAVLSNVEYRSGYCTTINISLNHRDDKMTVGAEYMDWQFVETPDETELKKHSTFLNYQSKSDAGINTHNDAAATADDATWLYKKPDGTVVDIYGHTGNSENDPYTINSAEELLAFAYEVKEGFKETTKETQESTTTVDNYVNFIHKYIKLDADITLQPSITQTTNLINWVGIGNAEHPFDGFFFGNGRNINKLYGEPFFETIGSNAVIDKVNFANVIEVLDMGVVANVNNGLICACNIEGPVHQTAPPVSGTSYCGSFVGDNHSFIIACTHNGEVAGHGYVGGLVGRNGGTIISSYHVGLVKYDDNATQRYNVGASTGLKEPNSTVFSCYFNNDFIEHTPDLQIGRAAFPRTTAEMQSKDFVDKTTDLWVDDGADVTSMTLDRMLQRHFSLNYALAVFCMWLNNEWTTNEERYQGADWTISTNCRDFNRLQVYWLKNHFGSHMSQNHAFKYIPGTYPKVY